MQQQKAAPLVFLPARALSAAQDLSSGFPSEAGGERSHPGQAMLAVKWKVCKAGATQAPHLIGKEAGWPCETAGKPFPGTCIT